MLKGCFKKFLLCFFLLYTSCVFAADQDSSAPPAFERLKDSIKYDFKDFYSWQTQSFVVVALGVSGVLANTSMDQHVANYYQDNIRDKSTNLVARDFKIFGDRPFVFTYVGATLLDVLLPHHLVTNWLGAWSERSLRSLLVGEPEVLFFQFALGPTRPSVQNPSSHWHGFRGEVGVSGHAFLGALPFMSAAFMTKNPAGKAGWFALASLTGLSRINDNAHYLSQVLLGWTFAYLSESSVNHSIHQNGFYISPTVFQGGAAGVGVHVDMK